MKDKMKEKLQNTSIDNVYLFTKVVMLLMAFLIFLQAIIRLLSADNFHTFTGFLLTGYLFIFGIAIFLIECNLKRARIWFYFMNFSLGKCMFFTFMAILCFGAGASISFFDILVGVIFALVAVMFAFFHCWFKQDEPAYVQKLIEEMNAKNQKSDEIAQNNALPGAQIV